MRPIAGRGHPVIRGSLNPDYSRTHFYYDGYRGYALRVQGPQPASTEAGC